MRVQIKLRSLGLYEGPIDGVMSSSVQEALRYFQDLKGLPKTGTMSTATLNAMGIPASN
ncbi:peptidoglycan-binding protein [Acidovorax sp. Root217]|nr:peptidoglycan-binding protein [Acidovorax sp. Root217]